MQTTTDQIIVLFDGVCNLCNGAVHFIIRRDKRNVFKYASLQSDVAQKLLTQHGLNPTAFDSIVVIENNHVYERSAAALKIASNLSGAWPLMKVFYILPRFIRDGVYNLIAKNRYRIFGRRDECMIPGPGVRERFL